MRIITVSVDDKVEKKFREIAALVHGKKKGYLGKAITEAMRLWMETHEKSTIAKVVKMLDKGFYMGGVTYKKREELHRR